MRMDSQGLTSYSYWEPQKCPQALSMYIRSLESKFGEAPRKRRKETVEGRTIKIQTVTKKAVSSCRTVDIQSSFSLHPFIKPASSLLPSRHLLSVMGALEPNQPNLQHCYWSSPSGPSHPLSLYRTTAAADRDLLSLSAKTRLSQTQISTNRPPI
jgi:hypothetical protein